MYVKNLAGSNPKKIVQLFFAMQSAENITKSLIIWYKRRQKAFWDDIKSIVI